MFDTHIYIDGIDGTGKTSLVNKLREVGYKYVFDRSILTKISFLPIKEFPHTLPPTDVIHSQIMTIKNELPADSSNRQIISQLDLDPHLLSQKELIDNFACIYIILDADITTCMRRICTRDTESNAWDSEPSLRYFRLKYLFISHKYSIPILDTTNKSHVEVYLSALTLINRCRCVGNGSEILSNEKTGFNPDLLELEWSYQSYSKIIYADDYRCVWDKESGCGVTDTNVESYQKLVLSTIVSNGLSSFLQALNVG